MSLFAVVQLLEPFAAPHLHQNSTRSSTSILVNFAWQRSARGFRVKNGAPFAAAARPWRNQHSSSLLVLGDEAE
jgi:hypothetical protein